MTTTSANNAPNVSKLRLGLLITGNPSPSVLKKHGDYHQIFTASFNDQLSALNAVQPTPFQSVEFTSYYCFENQIPKFDDGHDLDGWLITGSPSNSYDNDDWILKLVEFIQHKFNNTNTKLIGICFGFQLVVRALGGKVVKGDKGWEVGPFVIDVDDKYSKLLNLTNNQLILNQMHQDYVVEFPPVAGLEPFGTTDLCKYQGFYLPGRLLGVQGHPEYTEEHIKMIVDYRVHSGIFSEEFQRKVEEAQSRLKDHGGEFTSEIIKFLIQ